MPMPPPMPPEGGPPPRPGGPPPMPPPAPGADPGAPPAGGPPQPEDELAKVTAQVEGMLPEPTEGGYSFPLVEKLAAATAATAKALFGIDVKIDPGPAPDGGKIMGPLPTSVIVPAALLCLEAEKLGGGYTCDIPSLVDDGALKMLLATVQKMGADKKLKAAIGAAKAPPEKAAPPPKAKAKGKMKAAPTPDAMDKPPPKAAAQYM